MAVLKYYVIILFVLSSIWALSRLIKTAKFRQLIVFSNVFLFFLIFLEFSLNIVFRFENGNWIFQLKKHPNSALFEKHPYLSVVNKKNIEKDLYGIRISHNKNGQRSKEYDRKTMSSTTRIVTIGGSTTYGVGVNDWESWPNILDSLVGKDTIVLNLSVPGHTTVEHLITASLYLEEFNPDVVIIHAGLNDMRVGHVNELSRDYSNFHEPDLVGSMGLCYLENVPKIATLYYIVRYMQKMKVYPMCSFHSFSFSGKTSSEIDKIALSYFTSNFSRLIYMCKYYTKNIIVIPQVLVSENIEKDDLQWWIPFIPSEDLEDVLNTYNKTEKDITDSLNCFYLNEVEEYHWKSVDFTDASHLNKEGNKKLAKMIYKKLNFLNASRAIDDQDKE